MSTVDETNIHDHQVSTRSDGAHEVSGALVQQSLTQIFQSAPFRSSRQSQQLLQYIVDQTLAGHGELLKERLIGVNVFGRRPDYDTNEDPIVRARAGEVRKRLAQFYLGDGCQSVVRIEISPGSYHAIFTEVHPQIPETSHGLMAATVVPEMANGPAQAFTRENRRNAGKVHQSRRTVWIVVAASCLASVVAVSWFLLRPATPIDLFWKPVIDASNPVLLYSGANPVYMMSTEFTRRYEATHHVGSLERQGREFVVPLSPDLKLEPGDLVPYPSGFITLGDLSANVRIASLLTLHRKKFDLRCGGDIAFGDLRSSPTVLIGAFNNSWTMELTGDLPFIFGNGLTIREQMEGKRQWSPVFSQDGRIALDYAIVTRIPDSRTGEVLITVAGITQSGTRAAAEFITSPNLIQTLVRSAPQGWESKNMELVLETKVVNDIPTNPTLVAARYW